MDYPLDYIFKVINEKIKKLIYKSNNDNGSNTTAQNDNKKKYFTVLYIENVSQKFESIFNGMMHVILYCSINKLNNLIKMHKDPLLILQKEISIESIV